MNGIQEDLKDLSDAENVSLPTGIKKEKYNCSLCKKELFPRASRRKQNNVFKCFDCVRKNPRVKYTKEIIESIVMTSSSVSEVTRKLGLKPHGGTDGYIKTVIYKFGIDVSHFCSQPQINTNCAFQTAKVILVLRPVGSRRERAYKLRRALLETGRSYSCNECKITGIWNNKPIVLQVDHKNGKVYDDREDNLRFLCPNCHSQTENFGSKNKSNTITSFSC